MAVDLAKVSLWLATLARQEPLTFVDHALRHGDSLVGLSRRQIEAFHWDAASKHSQQGFETIPVREQVAKVADLRRRIRDAGTGVTDWDLRDWWDEARFELDKVRLFGDLATAAFFEATKPKAREARRAEYARAVLDGRADDFRGMLAERRREDPPLAPFHWELEFPEVFEQANPGFDAIVGNPPFLGGRRISTTLGRAYLAWLLHLHERTHGNGDLVSHFFRRAFNLVREFRAFGLIATNTIAQGDTRANGLRWICQHGGEIFSVRRRVKWPGAAAVTISILYISKGVVAVAREIDGRDVASISAFLFHRGGHDDPARLMTNSERSFTGSKIYGQGFLFDDKDPKRTATPTKEMRRLIDDDPLNQDVISPYISGEEVNTSPTHAHHRYVINFRDFPLRREDTTLQDAAVGKSMGTGDPFVHVTRSWASGTDEQRRTWIQGGHVPLDYPAPVAADWPELLAIVAEKVKPERMKLTRVPYRIRWWQFARTRPALNRAIAGLERVLVIAQVTKTMAFAFLPAQKVFSHMLVVFPYETYAMFCGLQSRLHEVWTLSFASSLEDRLLYTPSDCFETFPFPNGWETDQSLEAAGQTYYEFRACLMVRNDEGLTKTYNRFHDPCDDDPEISKLRMFHAAMDRAVLDAYGWADIPTDCEFLLDYEIDEQERGNRTKPYRYRWPDDVRDEVLARLLELNVERAAEEK